MEKFPNIEFDNYLWNALLTDNWSFGVWKLKHAWSSGPSRQLLIQKYTKMTAMGEANSSLAVKCLDFCQALTSQGMEINFSLNIGSTFSFSLDTRHKVPSALDSKKKKKASPSTLRRNARRRRDFLKKKRFPAAVTPISSATAYNSVAATNTTRNSDPPAYHHEDPVNALLSPGAGREPFFTTLSSEVEVPPNYVPSPPLCSTCGGRGYWKLSRIDSQRSWHHLYVCDSCCRYSKLVTPPDVAQFEIPVHVDWFWGLWYF